MFIKRSEISAASIMEISDPELPSAARFILCTEIREEPKLQVS
jgi:hypothetical protein